MTLNAYGRLSDSQLRIISARLQAQAATFSAYARYYVGNNASILDKAPRKDPDNRVPCAFARKIVDTLKGYLFAPGNITYSTPGAYQGALSEMFAENDEPLLTAEIGTDALINGEGYELLTINASANKIKQFRIIPGTGYAVYDNTLARTMLAFVHIVCNEPEDETTPLSYTRTIFYKDVYVTEQSFDLSLWTGAVTQAHPFKDVPVVVYPISIDRLPVFYAVLRLIDEHDKIISSNYANDMERFANAYLALLKSIDDETLAKLEQLRVFDDLGDGGAITKAGDAVSFVTKPSRGSDIAESADRFERLIYELAMVINPTDEKFGTASGIALQYKLLPMEFKAADITAYFSRGLQRRFALIANANEITGATPEPVTINWKRNIPKDLESIATIAGNLQGILSKKTILNLFPSDVVPDVLAELADVESTETLGAEETASAEKSDNDDGANIT